MYTLLSGAYKHYFRKDEYCILILGLDDSGKTTFLEQTKIKFSKGESGTQIDLDWPSTLKNIVACSYQRLLQRWAWISEKLWHKEWN